MISVLIVLTPDYHACYLFAFQVRSMRAWSHPPSKALERSAIIRIPRLRILEIFVIKFYLTVLVSELGIARSPSVY
jgi:hypothetical protein